MNRVFKRMIIMVIVEAITMSTISAVIGFVEKDAKLVMTILGVGLIIVIIPTLFLALFVKMKGNRIPCVIGLMLFVGGYVCYWKNIISMGQMVVMVVIGFIIPFIKLPASLSDKYNSEDKGDEEEKGR